MLFAVRPRRISAWQTRFIQNLTTSHVPEASLTYVPRVAHIIAVSTVESTAVLFGATLLVGSVDVEIPAIGPSTQLHGPSVEYVIAAQFIASAAVLYAASVQVWQAGEIRITLRSLTANIASLRTGTASIEAIRGTTIQVEVTGQMAWAER